MYLGEDRPLLQSSVSRPVGPDPGSLRRGKRSRLRTLRPSDAEMLYHIELSEEIGVRWRMRGATPSPAEHAQSHWAGSLATFVIEKLANREAVGIVSICDPALDQGRASIALMAFPGNERQPSVIEGAILAVNYAFAVWPIRKLYAEVLEFNLDQVASLSRHLFTEEARLTEWGFYGGHWWDLVYFSLTRQEWDSRKTRLLHRIQT